MKKAKSDQIASIAAKAVGIVAATGAAVMVLASLPDLVRYVRIKLM